jgi:CarD family transcriptional regulator
MAQKKKVSAKAAPVKSGASKRPAQPPQAAKAKQSDTKSKAPVKAVAAAKKPAPTKTAETKAPAAKSAPKLAPAKAAPMKAAPKPVEKAAPQPVAAKKPVAAVPAAAPKAPLMKPVASAAAPGKPAPAVAARPQASPTNAAPAQQPAVHRPAAHPAHVQQQARAVPASAKNGTAKVSATVTPKDVAAKAAEAARLAAAAKKPVSARHGFKTNEYIVYPAHGVGRIVGIEEQEIAGMSLELFVITFDKDKMTLRVPTGKLQSVGMRKLSDENIVRKAMETLKGRARVKRTMWSRRAQEYEAKINSGDLVSIAEVVRDLYRSESQPEQSYSERQLYEAALDRMAREIAAVDKLDERGAVQRITEVLSKSAKGRRAAAEGEVAEVEAEADPAADADEGPEAEAGIKAA